MEQNRIESPFNNINSDFVEIEGDVENITDLQNDIDDKINALFEEFGGDPQDSMFKINVKRVMPGRGELEHCFSCLASELPVTERIRKNFGAGAYEIWIYKDGKIWRRPKLNIAQPKETLESIAPQNNELSGVFESMIQMQQRQFEEMKAIIVANQPAPVNPMQSMQEMITTMQLMKELSGGNVPPPPTIDPMKQFESSMELAQKMMDMSGGTERSPSDALYKMAETIMPVLIEGAKTETTQKPTEAQSRSVRQTAQPIQNPTPTQNPTPSPEEKQNMFQMIIKRKLNELVKLAANNNDPELYADVMLDQIPDIYLDKLKTFISDPNAINRLAALNPAVNNSLEWFDAFKARIIDNFADVEPDLTPGDDTAENSTHVSKNADEKETTPDTHNSNIDGDTDGSGRD